MIVSNYVKLLVYVLMFIVASLLVWYDGYKNRCKK